jgi:hypothetical protein
MGNQVHWTVWAIFGMVAFLLLWNLSTHKQGNAIGFGVPKFGKKAVENEIASQIQAAAKTQAGADSQATGKTQAGTK